MKNPIKKVMVGALALCLGFGACSMVGCEKGKDPSEGKDPKIWAVYSAYAETKGDDALSYDEWLEELLATAKGKDGVTPHIGDNGNWYIGETDTGVKAEATDGEDGKDGQPGAKGNGWLWGEEAPAADLGNDGDLYLNYATGDIYGKAEGSWAKLNTLNVKGPEEEPPVDDGRISLGTQTVKVGETAEVDIDLDPGYYEISVASADLGKVEPIVSFDPKVAEQHLNTLMVYVEDRGAYVAILKILDGDKKLYLTTDTEISGEFTARKWEPPVLKADGQTRIVPSVCLAYSIDYEAHLPKYIHHDRLIPIPLDASLFSGKYKMTVLAYPTYPRVSSTEMVEIGGKIVEFIVRSEVQLPNLHLEAKDGSEEVEFTMSNVYFTNENGGMYMINRIVTVKIESLS